VKEPEKPGIRNVEARLFYLGNGGKYFEDVNARRGQNGRRKK